MKYLFILVGITVQVLALGNSSCHGQVYVKAHNKIIAGKLVHVEAHERKSPSKESSLKTAISRQQINHVLINTHNTQANPYALTGQLQATCKKPASNGCSGITSHEQLISKIYNEARISSMQKGVLVTLIHNGKQTTFQGGKLVPTPVKSSVKK